MTAHKSKVDVKTLALTAMFASIVTVTTAFIKIGDEFGKRDHSTVMSACKKVEAKLKKDAFYKQAINELEKQIKAK